MADDWMKISGEPLAMDRRRRTRSLKILASNARQAKVAWLFQRGRPACRLPARRVLDRLFQGGAQRHENKADGRREESLSRLPIRPDPTVFDAGDAVPLRPGRIGMGQDPVSGLPVVRASLPRPGRVGPVQPAGPGRRAESEIRSSRLRLRGGRGRIRASDHWQIPPTDNRVSAKVTSVRWRITPMVPLAPGVHARRKDHWHEQRQTV